MNKSFAVYSVSSLIPHGAPGVPIETLVLADCPSEALHQFISAGMENIKIGATYQVKFLGWTLPLEEK